MLEASEKTFFGRRTLRSVETGETRGATTTVCDETLANRPRERVVMTIAKYDGWDFRRSRERIWSKQKQADDIDCESMLYYSFCKTRFAVANVRMNLTLIDCLNFD